MVEWVRVRHSSVVTHAVLASRCFPGGQVGGLEAQHRNEVDGRPGCKYCIRLGRQAGQVHWVDIWRDPAAAAAVRAVNDGNETVPTVIVAGQPYTNPDPAWVRAQLSRCT